jgi:hypothetical protein
MRGLFYISILLIPTYLSGQMCEPQRVVYTSFGNTIGMQILQAVKNKNPNTFRSLLRQLVATYHGNKEGFFHALNARDQQGYNILTLCAITGDIVNLGAIFDALKDFYGNDFVSNFKYLDTRDKVGRGIIYLSSYNANNNLLEFVLWRCAQLVSKEDFFRLLTAEDNERGWKAIIHAADSSQSTNLTIMIKIAVHILVESHSYLKTLLTLKIKMDLPH